MTISNDKLVTVFTGPEESEALVIKGVLDANGIPAQVTGLENRHRIGPLFHFEVRVPEHLLVNARRVIAEATAAGAAAADAAGAETEK
jgi:hypothetical protein